MAENSKRVWLIDALGIAICLTLTAVVAAIVLQPLRVGLADEQMLETELAAQRDKAAGLSRALQAIERQLVEARRELEERRIQLRPADALNSRMAGLTELVESAGMIIEETTIGDLERDELHQTVPITLTGRCTYPQCAALLHQIHRQVPDVNVVAFELSGNPRIPDKPATFRIDLEWYAALDTAGTSL